MPGREQRRHADEALLQEIEAIRDLETEMRKLPHASVEFDLVASEIERRSRHVFDFEPYLDNGADEAETA